jgi:AAA ATPase domain
VLLHRADLQQLDRLECLDEVPRPQVVGAGKMRIAFESMPARFPPDESPFKGLPDDRCQCDHWGPLAPFEPFTEALAQAGAAEALQPSDTGDAGARHRLFDAVDSTLPDLAARAPLLLVFDDFHWADRATLLLTSFLLRSTRAGPMLVLGTYRDTELGRHTPLTGAPAPSDSFRGSPPPVRSRTLADQHPERHPAHRSGRLGPAVGVARFRRCRVLHSFRKSDI